MDRQKLGQTLRRIRNARSLTLRDVEKVSGVSYTYIAALETGQPNANITLATLEKIIGALGVEFTIVIGAEAPPLEALEPVQVARIARIARSLPALGDRTAEVLTASFEGAAEDAAR